MCLEINFVSETVVFFRELIFFRKLIAAIICSYEHLPGRFVFFQGRSSKEKTHIYYEILFLLLLLTNKGKYKQKQSQLQKTIESVREST